MKKIMLAVAAVVLCSALIAWQAAPIEDGAPSIEPEAAEASSGDTFSLPGAIAASISSLDHRLRMAVTVVDMTPLAIFAY